MSSIRRLSYVALAIAFAQIVFGAIVRITGSGWGCGEHWPKCAGYWVPPLERPDLIIEVSHRYLALGVTLVTLALAIVAWRRRREPGVAGRGGPLRTAIGAFAIVIATALLGMVTIKLRLNPIVATLGTNALLYAGVLGISAGSPRRTTSLLASIAGGETLGIPHAVIVALVAVAVTTVAVKSTVVGRRIAQSS